MEKIRLPKNKVFSSFVTEYPEYFTHGKGRFLVASKWEEKGFSVFSFGEDISINYNEDAELSKALRLLIIELKKKNKGIIKIRKR